LLCALEFSAPVVDRRGTNTIPLLQAGMAAAGTNAAKGAFGPGLRAEIVKTGNIDYGAKGRSHFCIFLFICMKRQSQPE
jgi:hypothetical protein